MSIHSEIQDNWVIFTAPNGHILASGPTTRFEDLKEQAKQRIKGDTNASTGHRDCTA